MARDEAPPWPRGNTYSGGGAIDANDLPGINFEGKVYRFEPTSPDGQDTADSSGRTVLCKVVRNASGVALLPSLIAKYKAVDPLETKVDGYTNAITDRPAGVVDELLPATGVPANDLFYVVIEGPTLVTANTSSISTTIGTSRLVPTGGGSGITDSTAAGRVAVQDLTGATATLGNNIQNQVGIAGATTTTANAKFKAVVHLIAGLR